MRASWPGRAAFALLACGPLLPGSPALASPVFDLTGDMAGIGGLSARVVPASSAVAYFNPALLVDAPSELTLGFVLLSQQIAIELDGRPGTQFAVPTGLQNAGHADASRWDNYPIATDVLQNGREADGLREALVARPRQAASSSHATHSYELVGFVAKLFRDRAAVGFHGLIPNGDFTTMRAFYNDEREQYFSNSLHPELYSDRMTAVSIAFGAGVRLLDRLSLGVGSTLSLRALVDAPTYVVDTGRLQDILIDTDAKVKVSLSPYLGLAYSPLPVLRLTATAHAPEKVELATGFTFLLANGVEQGSELTFVHDYTPWRFGAGASFDLFSQSERALSLAATLVYATWSQYLDRHGDEPTKAYAWSDTLSPTIGVRYRVAPVGTFLDVAFQPTPVPPQTGRTNYVDSDRVSGSAGADLTFEWLDTEMRVGAQFQLHHLLSRHQAKLPTPVQSDGRNHTPELVKDEVPDDAQISGEPVADIEGLQTNNPGWPGFGSSGFVLGGGLHFSVQL
jgi:hypothetical protein